MTQREQKLLLIAGGAVALLVGYFGFTSWYQKHNVLADQIAAAEGQARDDANALDRRSRSQAALARLREKGLRSKAQDAEQQMIEAGTLWRDQSKVKFTGTTTDKGKFDKGFERIEQKMSVSGTQAAVANLLWKIETTDLPIRVNSVSVTAREGRDELNVQIGLSTLCESTGPAKTVAGRMTK